MAVGAKCFSGLLLMIDGPAGPVGMMDGVATDVSVESVYRSIHGRLWRALWAMSGDRDVASDAEAEAFAEVLRRGDAVEDVAGWVWRSAFRIANGLLAERSRPMTSSEVMSNETAGEGSLSEFLSLLGSLSAQQRACVVLRYVGDLSAAEIGTLLGTSAGTVRVQLHRAHRSLRQSLKEAGHA
jgi:RNA polymerase sigma factor (sigma-70 family)